MDERCRACLKLHDIFFNTLQHFINNKLVSDMLKECTTVVVQTDDGLPLNICINCLDKLNSAYEFKVMVTESNRKLNSLANKDARHSLLYNDTCNDNVIIKEETVLIDIQNFSAPKNNFNSKDANEFANPSSSSVNNCGSDIQDVSLQNKQILKSKDNEYSLPYEEWINSVNRENDKSNCIQEIEYVQESSPLHYVENSLSVDVGDKSFDNFYCATGMVAEVTAETKQNRHPSEDEYSSPDVTDGYSSPDVTDGYHNKKVGLTDKEKNKKSIFCKECKKSFGFRYYFEVHVRYHSGIMPFKCEVCDKGFAKQFILNKHKAIHSDNKSFTCDQCGKSLRFLSDVINHKISHSDVRAHRCNICGKSFKRKYSLKVHILRHKGERKYTCEICGKCFVDKSSLCGHMVYHRNEKKFSCPECGKSFASNAIMKKHFKRHSNEKPYACSYCDKSFNHRNVLKRHILIHTGAKPYSCKLCDKPFRQSASLSNHMRVHTGETPFACEQCPLKFKYKHHLSNHIKSH